MSHTVCPNCHARLAPAGCCGRPRRSGGLIAGVFKLALVYVGMIFTAGTLVNTGHPVAVETGRLLQTVTFIDPLIRWTGDHGMAVVSHGLQTVSDGMRFS